MESVFQAKIYEFNFEMETLSLSSSFFIKIFYKLHTLRKFVNFYFLYSAIIFLRSKVIGKCLPEKKNPSYFGIYKNVKKTKELF